MSKNELHITYHEVPEIIAIVTCIHCATPHRITMTNEQWERMVLGDGYIQEILHDKTPEERELLISETCNACWDRIFGEDE